MLLKLATGLMKLLARCDKRVGGYVLAAPFHSMIDATLPVERYVIVIDHINCEVHLLAKSFDNYRDALASLEDTGEAGLAPTEERAGLSPAPTEERPAR